jgi:hypothetical protein
LDRPYDRRGPRQEHTRFASAGAGMTDRVDLHSYGSELMMQKFIGFLILLFLVVLPYLFLTAYSINAAGIIYRRGRKTWGILTAVTAIIGIGWVLAVRGLIKRPVTTDMDLGTLCPSCGHGKGYREEKSVDTKNGDDLISILELITLMAGMVLCIFFIIYYFRLLITHTDLFILYSAVIAVLAVGGYYLVKPVIHYLQIEKERTEEYWCGKCEHIWNKYTVSDIPSG